MFDSSIPCRVAVMGGGTMGRNIALSLLLHGHEVVLFDVAVVALENVFEDLESNIAVMRDAGLMETVEPWRGRLTLHQNCADALAGAALVIEAIPEQLGAKQALYAEVERQVNAETILASNTSSFLPSRLAEGLRNPERFVVLHYWNPAHLIPLVEIVPHAATRSDVVVKVEKLLRACAKRPIVLRHEVAGFIGNRLAFALQREAMDLVEKGVVSPDDIDQVVRAGFGRRLMVGGLFGTADMGGLDVYLAICQSLFPALSNQQEAPRKLVELVAAQRLGIKTGEGWYRYDGQTGPALQAAVAAELIRWAKIDQEKSLSEGL